jgi:DNA-binding LytR/AlgR family response regulator
VNLRALVIEDEWATRNSLVELLQASGAVEVVGAVADLEAVRATTATGPVRGPTSALRASLVTRQRYGMEYVEASTSHSSRASSLRMRSIVSCSRAAAR